MRISSAASVVVALAMALGAGCAKPRDPQAPSPKFAGTSYYESGDELFIGVDLRAAWIGGPRNLLPVYLVVARKEGNDRLDFGRESFVLEFPDKSRTALATYEDYEDNYDRGRADARMVVPYLESIQGRFPQPPFQWQGIEFFPVRASGVFPREDFDVINQQLWHGYLYFPLPADPPHEGRYKLLATPTNREVTYVVDFPAFGDDKASR